MSPGGFAPSAWLNGYRFQLQVKHKLVRCIVTVCHLSYKNLKIEFKFKIFNIISHAGHCLGIVYSWEQEYKILWQYSYVVAT